MNDILAHIIDKSKDTILIRALLLVNKYLNKNSQQRLDALIQAPHINVRKIYGYNMFIIKTQYTGRGGPVVMRANHQLLKHHRLLNWDLHTYKDPSDYGRAILHFDDLPFGTYTDVHAILYAYHDNMRFNSLNFDATCQSFVRCDDI